MDLSCLAEDLIKVNGRKIDTACNDGSHDPQNTAGKRLGKAVAVLAEMVDWKWALFGAQAASECHDPVNCNVI